MELLLPTQLLGRIPRNDVLAYKSTIIWYRTVNFIRRINNDTLHLLETDTMSPLAVSSAHIYHIHNDSNEATKCRKFTHDDSQPRKGQSERLIVVLQIPSWATISLQHRDEWPHEPDQRQAAEWISVRPEDGRRYSIMWRDGDEAAVHKYPQANHTSQTTTNVHCAATRWHARRQDQAQ